MAKKKTPSISPLSMLSRKVGQEIPIEELAKQNLASDASISVLSVDPNKGRNWKYHDRPDSELGDLEGLAAEFRDPQIGQQQPCIVRTVNDDPNIDFEVLLGERRWRAAILAKTKLKIIYRELSDKEASIAQIAENFNRKDLSDFAEGMSLHRLISDSLLKQKEVAELFKLSPKQINRLLSFSQVPQEIWDAVGDMSKISARTASEIRAILKKNPEYTKILIELAPKLREGKIGANSLLKEIDKKKQLNIPNKKIEEENIGGVDGEHMFTWKKDPKGCIAIRLTKKITNKVNKTELQKVIVNELTRQIKLEGEKFPCGN